MATSDLIHVGGRVLAAIDASPSASSVCDYAVWAARRLEAPLEFVHALDRHPETAPGIDLSGNLDLGEREALLQELTRVDERRSRLAQERGRLLLQDASQRATAAGIAPADLRLRNGALVETLTELERDVRLFVLGKRGEQAGAAKGHLGSNLERVVRAVHRPLLVAPGEFKPVQRFAIAYDGSSTTRKGVEMVAASPLFRGMPCHLLMAGADTPEARGHLEWAREVLSAAGFEVHAAVQAGDADAVISEHVRAEGIDLLIMGAYGHSRIRQLIVGSTTTSMLRTCEVPVLLLR